MLNITAIPNTSVDFIDPQTGKVARPWRMFLENLWILQGSGTSSITIVDLQSTPQFEPPTAGAVVSDDVTPPQTTKELPDDVTPSSDTAIASQLLINLDEFRVTPPVLLNVPISSYLLTSFTTTTSVVVAHNFGKYPVVNVIDSTGVVIVPLAVTHASVNDFTVTFLANTTGNVIAVIGN